MTPLIDLLDGRNDVADRQEGRAEEYVPYEPAKRRWAKSTESLLVTSTKVECIKVLHQIADMHQNQRLSLLLTTFLDLYTSTQGKRTLDYDAKVGGGLQGGRRVRGGGEEFV